MIGTVSDHQAIEKKLFPTPDDGKEIGPCHRGSPQIIPIFNGPKQVLEIDTLSGLSHEQLSKEAVIHNLLRLSLLATFGTVLPTFQPETGPHKPKSSTGRKQRPGPAKGYSKSRSDITEIPAFQTVWGGPYGGPLLLGHSYSHPD